MSAPVPTADIGCDLVKISASGPMPTSRYCDHRPSASSTSLTRAASGEPGRTLRRLSPMTPAILRRTASARAGSPRACSSITRSSMLATKVTPAALIACRSQGASSHGAVRSRPSIRGVAQGPRKRRHAPQARRRADFARDAADRFSKFARASARSATGRAGRRRRRARARGPAVGQPKTRPISSARAAVGRQAGVRRSVARGCLRP